MHNCKKLKLERQSGISTTKENSFFPIKRWYKQIYKKLSSTKTEEDWETEPLNG